ncbi:MAG TPA: penicillin acylase family protein, partial [Thermoanaerobaculia bacterium]|nr:penicillin acylase family protein [Thermoanaerobaculia bacterium]
MAQPLPQPPTPDAVAAPDTARHPHGRGRRWLRRILLTLTVLAGVLLVAGLAGGLWLRSEIRSSLPQLDGERAIPGLGAAVSIERDGLGVPTIRAASRRDAVRALGFLHAQDRFFQMDLMRRQAAGELSELFGPAALDVDRQNRVHRFRHVARQSLARATPEERAILESYAAGVNAGLGALAAKPFEYVPLRLAPAPWKAEDSILVVLAMFRELQGGDPGVESSKGMMADLLPRQLFDFLTPAGTEWDAPIEGGPIPMPPLPGPEVIDLRAAPAQAAAYSSRQLDETAGSYHPGSNNWAVAGSHTADGRALLANDMHLGLGVPNTWYRASIIRPDGS